MYNTDLNEVSIKDLQKLSRRFNAGIKINSDIELRPDGKTKTHYSIAVNPNHLLTFGFEGYARAAFYSNAKIVPEEIVADYERRDDAFDLIESILTDGGFLYDPRGPGNNSFPPQTMLKITSAESVEEIPYDASVIRRWLNEMYGLVPASNKSGPAAAP